MQWKGEFSPAEPAGRITARGTLTVQNRSRERERPPNGTDDPRHNPFFAVNRLESAENAMFSHLFLQKIHSRTERKRGRTEDYSLPLIQASWIRNKFRASSGGRTTRVKSSR